MWVLEDRPTGKNLNQLIEMFVLEKTLYEICYQAANRSGWIPLAGAVEIIDNGK
jgi:predicted trehalose synthase